ncbi:MAG: hypothetical protein U9Q19_00085 [Pseudomonadota bacterium]|nr:hypothetical protein [Pseudomonadota bacterium]
MTTERQLEQSVPSEEEANPEDAGVQPIARRVAYKTVLAAVVIGIVTISALWLFVMRPEGSPVTETLVTAPDVQVHEDKLEKALPVAKTDPSVESMSRTLVSISGRIDRRFEAQQTHSVVVKRELSVMTESLQTIKAAIADLGESHKTLGRQISEGTSQLSTLVKAVRALKVVKRKPAASHKPRPVKTPPFHIDAIDVWDDVTYVAVSQAGRAAFLKLGEQQSGWTVSRIDRLKGQVDLKGPAGQVHSVSLQR